MEGGGSFLRLPPPEARHVGIRLWSMDRPSAKARERGGAAAGGAAHPPAAGRSPAAGLFEGQGPGPRTPPPPPGPRAAPWPRGTVAHGRSGGPVGGAGGPGRRYGGAAAFGGRGGGPAGPPPPGQPNKRAWPGAKGPGPRSFRALRAQPPPPSAGFFINAKAASCNSLAHWASASLLPPLAALGSRSSQRPFRGAEKAASSNAERQRKSPAPQSMGRAT